MINRAMSAMKALKSKILPSKVDCREANTFIRAYIDGSLPGNQKLEFEQHLGYCVPCTKYIREYLNSVTLSHSANPVEEKADCNLPEDLIKAIRSARRKAPK